MADPAAFRAAVHRKYEREELRRRLDDPTLTIANVLPRASWEEVRIPGSLCLPVAEVEDRARDIFSDLEQEICVHCGGPT